MDLREIALTNIGLILDGRASPTLYTEKDFPAPYNKVIAAIKKNPEAIGNKDVAVVLYALPTP